MFFSLSLVFSPFNFVWQPSFFIYFWMSRKSTNKYIFNFYIEVLILYFYIKKYYNIYLSNTLKWLKKLEELSFFGTKIVYFISLMLIFLDVIIMNGQLINYKIIHHI